MQHPYQQGYSFMSLRFGSYIIDLARGYIRNVYQRTYDLFYFWYRREPKRYAGSPLPSEILVLSLCGKGEDEVGPGGGMKKGKLLIRSYIVGQTFGGDISQVGVVGVLLGQQRVTGRPVDSEIRIRPQDAPLVSGGIKVAALIDAESRFAQNPKPVCESLGDKELSFVFSGEEYACPSAEIRRSPADIHRHIIEFSLDDLDEFSLGMGVLIMQPPECGPGGAGEIILHKGRMDTQTSIPFLMKRLHKEAAFVREDARFQNQNARKRGWDDVHLALRSFKESRG
jgi:hypothetical protein